MHTYTMYDLLYIFSLKYSCRAAARARHRSSDVQTSPADRRRLCKCDLSGLDEGDEGLHDVPAVLAELSLGDRLVELHLRPHVSR